MGGSGSAASCWPPPLRRVSPLPHPWRRAHKRSWPPHLIATRAPIRLPLARIASTRSHGPERVEPPRTADVSVRHIRGAVYRAQSLTRAQPPCR
eukprot:5531325-Prymnesium_polylepis.1